MKAPSLVALLAAVAPSAGRRRGLADSSDHLSAFRSKFRVRHHQFTDSEHFGRRLAEHESALPPNQLQTFLVELKPEVKGSAALSASIEKRAGVVVDGTVSGDLQVHATTVHAERLRALEEVHRVVPMLPEFKLTPHFDEMFPAHMVPNSSFVQLTVRLVPLARHEHLRLPPASLAARYSDALRDLCASSSWKGRRSCLPRTATDKGISASAALRVDSTKDERLLVVRGVALEDAHDVGVVVSAQPETLWVEPHAPVKLLNNEAAEITQSGSLSANNIGPIVGLTPIWDMGLHGEGEIIGVGDSGLDTGHCFFENSQGQSHGSFSYSSGSRKVVAYHAFADGGATGTYDHGTHVTGSILGYSSVDGATGSEEKGVAYEAKVSFTDIGVADEPFLTVPNDLVADFYEPDYAQGARIHSNSWGASLNQYTLYAQMTDQMMFQRDDFVILVAAGNDGTSGPGSVGAPATCKNCVTVGASENDDGLGGQDGDVAFFSSLGPTAQGGAYKPDVVAPGYWVTSANSNSAGDCPVTEMAGTSMATPVTAGNIALIRQYMREGWYPQGVRGSSESFVPSGALLKAMVVQSSVSMGGSFEGTGAPVPLDDTPSNVQGFGRVQLNRVLFKREADGTTPAQRLLVRDDPAQPISQAAACSCDVCTAADASIYEFDVTTTGTDPILGSEFKATLVWTDPPAEAFSNTPLINDLDLVVEVNGATTWGNYAAAGDGANTVEQVVLTVPTTSTSIKVRVCGFDVPQGPQPFALVMSGPFEASSADVISVEGAVSALSNDGDGAAFGVGITFLILAVLGGGYMCYQKNQKKQAAFAGGKAAQYASAGGAPPVSSVKLPAGWRALVDPASGRTYYLNEKTGQTTWEVPKEPTASDGAPPPPPPPADNPPGLPAGWTSGKDPMSGRMYYFNQATGKSQWTPP